MKKFLLNVGVALMACVTVVSCSDENDSIQTYPTRGHESGVWTAVDDSTSYSCDVHLGTYDTLGEYAFVTIASSEAAEYFNGQGAYAYDQTSGTITITFTEGTDEATAILKYDDLSGDAINVTIGEQTYKISKATYPTSIAGEWSVSTIEEEVTTTTVFEFLPNISESEVYSFVAKTTVGDEIESKEGTYVYDSATGVATLTFAEGIDVVMQINSKSTVSATITIDEVETEVSRFFTAE